MVLDLREHLRIKENTDTIVRRARHGACRFSPFRVHVLLQERCIYCWPREWK